MTGFCLQDCATFAPYHFAKGRSVFVKIYIQDSIKIFQNSRNKAHEMFFVERRLSGNNVPISFLQHPPQP